MIVDRGKLSLVKRHHIVLIQFSCIYTALLGMSIFIEWMELRWRWGVTGCWVVWRIGKKWDRTMKLPHMIPYVACCRSLYREITCNCDITHRISDCVVNNKVPWANAIKSNQSGSIENGQLAWVFRSGVGMAQGWFNSSTICHPLMKRIKSGGWYGYCGLYGVEIGIGLVIRWTGRVVVGRLCGLNGVAVDTAHYSETNIIEFDAKTIRIQVWWVKCDQQSGEWVVIGCVVRSVFTLVVDYPRIISVNWDENRRN